MYALLYDKRIPKDLKGVPRSLLQNLLHHIESLADQPRRHGVVKLTGIDGYRLRVGDYRVLFQIDDQARTVTVYRIKHRREAYR